MLVVFQGDMILKYNKGHQYTPFLTEAGCGNLASVSVMKVAPQLACSRRSDSEARAKTKASSSSPPVSPRFFPALSLALFFARAPLSERLEQATPQF